MQSANISRQLDAAEGKSVPQEKPQVAGQTESSVVDQRKLKRSIYALQWYHKNKERLTPLRREHYKKNSERIKLYNMRRWERIREENNWVRQRRSPNLLPTKEFIMANVSIDEKGCWNWLKSLNVHGYGQISVNGCVRGVHRIAWILWKGEIHDGLGVFHHCDNRKCCNWEHLFIGTSGDNNNDCANKGRHFHKITKEMAMEILSSSDTLTTLAKKYSVAPSIIWKVRKRIHPIFRRCAA